jgi:hypothetical protein
MRWYILCIMRRSFVEIQCNFCVKPESIPLIRNQFLGIISGKTWIHKNVKSAGKPDETTHCCWSDQIIIIYTQHKSGFCVTGYSLKYQTGTYHAIYQQPTFDMPYSVLMLHHPQCHSTTVHSNTHCPPPTLPEFTSVLLHQKFANLLVAVLHQLNSQLHAGLLRGQQVDGS